MSKRKLSRKQTWRAQKIQEERINRAKKKQGNIELSHSSLGSEEPGRVIASFGVSFIIEDGKRERITCLSRQNLGSIVVGDNIIWQRIDDNNGVITAINPRESLLERPNYHGNTKAVASNIDQMIIVCSPIPQLQTSLIDRYLVAVELNNIKPLIAINKVDLLNKEALNKLKSQLEQYQDIDYDLLYFSTKNQKGMSQLESVLKDRISILVGQSGVGKSSTVKALLPDIDIQIGELSKTTRLGKHTTSASQLYHLPFGGELIDSPGVRDFGLWHLPAERICNGFVEFREHLGQCKFSNCTHRNEPECAIIEAVNSHKISKARWDNYCEIYTALKNLS